MLKENFKYVKLLSNQSYAKFSRVVLKSKILERAEHSGYRRGVYKIDKCPDRSMEVKLPPF